MSDRDVIFKLAKVMIAAAWADGDVSNEEVNSLKDLLFQLPQVSTDQGARLSAQEWARLEMYIQSPVGAGERARLLADLQDALRSGRQKQLALTALQNVVSADGVVLDDENQVVSEIRQAIESAEVGLLAELSRLVGGAVQRRSAAVANAPNREAFFDDFIKNKVYYAVSRRLHIEQVDLDIPKGDLRKLSLAGGLMAKVAHVDRQVTDDEFDSMVQALQTHWHMGSDEATFVAEVAISAIDVTYDSFRMLREFAAVTTVEERRHFLDILFAVASADGASSNDEIEEIRRIARGLNLTHKDFINAKVRRADAPVRK